MAKGSQIPDQEKWRWMNKAVALHMGGKRSDLVKSVRCMQGREAARAEVAAPADPRGLLRQRMQLARARRQVEVCRPCSQGGGGQRCRYPGRS